VDRGLNKKSTSGDSTRKVDVKKNLKKMGKGRHPEKKKKGQIAKDCCQLICADQKKVGN